MSDVGPPLTVGCPEQSGSGQRRRTRRRLLASGGTALLVGVAGCTAVEELLVDVAYRDLNLLNDSNERIEMHVLVVTGTDEVVFEETVRLDVGEAEQYGGLWNDDQEYTVWVELARGDSDSLHVVPVSGDDAVVVIYRDGLELEHRH